MPHITLPEGIPGIVGPMLAYPETAAPMNALAEVLLLGPSSLSPAERELIATSVSSCNECYFCTQTHAAAAREHFGSQRHLVDSILADRDAAPVTDKLRALLDIAEKVRRDGRLVRPEDISRAREAGADDQAIHDTVLIAAAFCMFNRYVEGLATWAPRDQEMYDRTGAMLANEGYVNAPDKQRAPAVAS